MAAEGAGHEGEGGQQQRWWQAHPQPQPWRPLPGPLDPQTHLRGQGEGWAGLARAGAAQQGQAQPWHGSHLRLPSLPQAPQWA